METLLRSFDEVMSIYNHKYNELIKDVTLSDCELGRKCDYLRKEYLLEALKLAENREDCQSILVRLTKRNIEIKEKVLEKMKKFPTEMKQSC